MAEWRFARGWSHAELAERLAHIEALPRSVDEQSMDAMTPDHGWRPERFESVIACEAPGPPVPDGPFARAREAVAGYRFSDPRIVRAYFDPARPLLGRPMLLELRVLGLRYLNGTVIAKVLDDADERASRFGFRYDTLRGHLERGAEWFVVEKDHARGDVRFCITSRWQDGDFPNWWSHIGFDLLAPIYRARWLRRSHERLRAIANAPTENAALARGERTWSREPPLEDGRPA